MGRDNMIIKLTAEIVSAYVGNNPVPTKEVALLISSTRNALLEAYAESEEQVESNFEPAVPVRTSVKADHLICLVCGGKHKMLKKHLMAAHGLSPAQYRTLYNLPTYYPIVAPAHAKKRSLLAKKMGLGKS